MSRGGKFIDISERTYGRLTAVREVTTRTWEFRCACGTSVVMRKKDVTATRGARSCGCLKRERAATLNRSYGKSNTSGAYPSWMEIKRRCYDPKRPAFPNYGGRGISMCRAWRESFEAFLADVGQPPTRDHSIDRIDNDGNYEPGNCRWATRTQQCRNRRTVRACVVDGRVFASVAAAVDFTGLKRGCLDHRLRSRHWPAYVFASIGMDRATQIAAETLGSKG